MLINAIWIIIILIRIALNKEDKTRFKEKFAIFKQQKPNHLKTIWIHGASAGEMMSMVHLINLLSKKYFVVCTSVTKEAMKITNSYCKNENVLHLFMPCDTKFFIRKFINFWQPKTLIVFESEFWPSMLQEASKSMKLYLINAKLSDRSFKRWKFFSFYFKRLLKCYSGIYAVDEIQMNKFKYFNVNKNIKCLGNIKRDSIFYIKHKANELTQSHKTFYDIFVRR